MFSLLSLGARFDKSRFNEDIEIFKKRKQCEDSEEPPERVDFFGSVEKSDLKREQQNSKTENVKVDAVELMEPKIYCKKKHIKTTGSEAPDPIQSFAQLMEQYMVPKVFIKKALEHGFSEPTPIQAQSIPVMMSGRDLMGIAPTGSGKTLSFLLPLAALLQESKQDGIRCLIVSPTRELATQICREFTNIVGKKIKAHLLTSGNMKQLKDMHDVLITTPLRLVHAIKQELVDLSVVKHLIIDEADKLFELGYIDQIDEIIAACKNEQLQKAMFSATMPSHVETLANSIMKEPIRVIVGRLNSATETIEQKLLFVGQEEGKLLAVRQLIAEGMKPPVLIFVESIERSKALFKELVFEGVNVDVINSEKPQIERDEAIKNFRSGKTWVLIATDLLGRGLDFKGVNLVLNYDFPRSAASYIHRIGRTGRAGRTGKAVTLFTKEDHKHLKSIANVMKGSGCEVPDWMLNLPSSKDAAKKRRKTQT